MQKNIKERGGIALEYLVISLVTIAMSFAAVKVVKTSIKDKMDELSQQLGGLPEGSEAWQELMD